jgi:hypothetical protein
LGSPPPALAVASQNDLESILWGNGSQLQIEKANEIYG